MLLSLPFFAISENNSYLQEKQNSRYTAITKGVLAGSALFLSQMVAAITILPTPPKLDNKAFVLMDYDSGAILGAFNADAELPPASLTKMMTSYIVEQQLIEGKLKETDMVNMPAEAWCRGVSTESCMYVPLNGKASVIDLLRGLIIQSGNDAAKALAIHMAGSETNFADMMNEKSKEMGLKHTHFVNASGLPATGHYSSAYDMAIIARNIINNSVKYYPMYAEKDFTYNGIKQENRNLLLKSDPTVDGLKTGHTNEAGFCLVASSKRGDMRIISAVMGTKSMVQRAAQSRELLNWSFENFHKQVFIPAQQSIQKVPVLFAKTDTVSIGVLMPLSTVVAKGQTLAVKTEIHLTPNLTAPISKGQVVGSVSALLDGKEIAKQPLIALESAERSDFLRSIWQHVKHFFMGLFGRT